MRVFIECRNAVWDGRPGWRVRRKDEDAVRIRDTFCCFWEVVDTRRGARWMAGVLHNYLMRVVEFLGIEMGTWMII